MASLSVSKRRALNFARRLRLARARFGRSYPALLRDFMDFYIRHGYTPREVFLYELLNNRSMRQKRQTTISKAGLVALQQKLNTREAARLVEDKSLFYSCCGERGLAAPRLLALWEPDGGRTAEGVPLRDDGDWTSFLTSLDAPDIVVKPSLGVYGRGIRLLRRSGEQWRDHDDRLVSAADIVRELRHDPQFDRFVVQERIVPHPRLVELSATDYIQSMRIVTGVTPASEVEIFFADQKIICGRATVSNFAWGATGNAFSDIQPETGTLTPPLVVRADGVGMDPIERHPVTGMRFEEFVIPFWDETLALCRRAALEFLPLRTVGWDVAVTPNGPLLIEGNAWWDPNKSGRMGSFLSYAHTALEAA